MSVLTKLVDLVGFFQHDNIDFGWPELGILELKTEQRILNPVVTRFL